MDALAGVTFGDSGALALLAALPLVAWFAWARERARRLRADAFASERIRGVRFPARALRPLFVTLGLGLAALALSAPRFGFELRPVLHDEGTTVIAIDVSNSMAAEDIGISRLEGAKAIARRIALEEKGRVALIAFESIGVLVSPFTTDTTAVADLIDSLVPGELALPGSDLGAAILTAVDYLEKSGGGGRREIVLISDGEDQGSLRERAVEIARERGIAVTTVAVGATEGVTIPSPRTGEPLRTEEGEIVTTRANPETLAEIAEATGGRAFVNPFDERALAAIAAKAPGEVTAEEGRMQRVPVERFQWPLAAGLLLLLAGSFANRGAE
ncbi:MAG: VWA domain-containing protein [Thermoanaerobaculia bacterium]